MTDTSGFENAMIDELNGEQTDPENCRHRLVQIIRMPTLPDTSTICVGCESTLDLLFLKETEWDYDFNYHLWVRDKRYEDQSRDPS